MVAFYIATQFLLLSEIVEKIILGAFEVVFAVDLKENVNRFLMQSEINYEIFEIFQREGIKFAYPTQTLYVHKNQVNQD